MYRFHRWSVYVIVFSWNLTNSFPYYGFKKDECGQSLIRLEEKRFQIDWKKMSFQKIPE